MLYLAGKATVFGISATAEVDTVVGNYDLRYLKEQLKDKFHNTPSYLKDKTRVALEERWKCYTDGAISVHGEVISSIIQGFHAEDYCKTFMGVEFARYLPEYAAFFLRYRRFCPQCSCYKTAPIRYR